MESERSPRLRNLWKHRYIMDTLWYELWVLINHQNACRLNGLEYRCFSLKLHLYLFMKTILTVIPFVRY